MNGVLDHVEIENNAGDGLLVSPVGPTINLTVSDSVSANNAADGIHTSSVGGAVSVMVRNSTIANNGAMDWRALLAPRFALRDQRLRAIPPDGPGAAGRIELRRQQH